MSIRTVQNSFAKGILSPALQGRVDLSQYSIGLKELKNGIVLQEGSVQNRSGLEFITEVKDSTKKVRLFPFIFDFNQNYIIEAGEKYFRFIKNGGYILDNENNIYEIKTPYLENDLFDIDYVQQADVITFVHQNYNPNELSRIKHNQWELKEINFQSKINPPVGLTATYTGSLEANTITYEYVITSVDKNTNEESSRSNSVFVSGHIEAYWKTNEYITLSWSKVQNALEYNIYRSVNGIMGYVGTTNTTTFKDTNIEPDLTSTAPYYKNPFAENKPSCVCYYQQRKIYASSKNEPQTLWASQSGTDNNFNISRPLNASDSITLTMSDNSSGKIRHLIPLDDLIVMTTNAEWSTNGADGAFCANPAPVASLQSYYGASKIKPVISGSMLLFVQSGGNIIRDMGYNYMTDSYDGQELTLFAGHLFEGKKIIDMAYSKEPYRILWCVMDDFTINALTYNPSQKIAAWHTHTTKGNFESITVIRENEEDIAYFVIKRVINNVEKRYIERFKTRVIKSLDESFFLDCALKKVFDNEVKTVSGLEHLKGEKVNALLDNGVVENLTVDLEGKVSLPYKSKNVLIGLPYTFELETLNIEAEGTLGLNKIINKVEIKILNSREDFFIENDNKTLSQNARCHDSINHPEKLYTTDVEFCPLSTISKQANVKIVQKLPLALHILSIATTISIQEVEQQ